MFKQTLQRAVRFNSTVATKAQGIATKATNLSNQTVYYGKVTAELAKEVYLKEGLAPPSVAQFKQVYTELYQKTLQYVFNPQQVVNCVSKIKKNDVVLYGAYAVQLAGLYSLGEIIGRRNIVGYPSYHH